MPHWPLLQTKLTALSTSTASKATASMDWSESFSWTVKKRLDVFQNFLMISSGMALGGYIAFFFSILFFSGKITRPVTESYEKQKRFITDAGHEIKTPLAIIRADTEVLEMDLGESEWSSDIKKQTKRLELITNDLIFLSRLEEAGNSLQMVRLPFSDIVAQEAASFTSLMKTQNRIFQCDIQPMVSLTGDEKSIRQLVNILMDNALKYSPPHGLISLIVKKQGKQIRLALYNTTEKPIPKDRLAILFDRFYRVDSSRNTQIDLPACCITVAAKRTASLQFGMDTCSKIPVRWAIATP